MGSRTGVHNIPANGGPCLQGVHTPAELPHLDTRWHLKGEQSQGISQRAAAAAVMGTDGLQSRASQTSVTPLNRQTRREGGRKGEEGTGPVLMTA